MGGTNVNIPNQNLTNQLSQIYQGIANTAGPYADLSGILGPLYGQQSLTNTQQGLFGYYGSGQPGGIGTPAGPGYSGQSTGSFPVAGGGQPSSFPVAGGQPSAGSFPTAGGATPTMGPGAPSGGGNSLYSPPSGTLIGLGPSNAFNDPYAGQTQPSQSAGYHPGTLGLNTSALGTYGPLATNALLGSNPYLSDALNLQNIAAFNAATPTDLQNSLNNRALSPDSLLSGLQQQAGSQLASGGQLSPQEQRDLTQQSLSSLGQGGLVHGNTGIAVDLLSRDSAVRQRQQQAQQFVSMVEGLNQQQNQFGLGVQNQNLSQQGLAGQLAGTAASTASSAITNPLLQLLFGFNTQGGSPSSSIDQQNSLFNPYQQLGSSISNFNANANANSSIANANSSAAQTSGLLSLFGSLLGSAGTAYSDERLKKNIKKVGESPSGIPEYEFEYKTDDLKRIYRGAMAQDLEKLRPDAVAKDPVTGMKYVNYSVLDVPFIEVFNPYDTLKEAA